MNWTKKEINALRKYYSDSPWEEIQSRIPNRTLWGIMQMASSLKIKRKRTRKSVPHKELKPLVERRRAADISQIAFTEVFGYDLSVVSRLESGKTKPNKYHLKDYNDTLERFGA